MNSLWTDIAYTVRSLRRRPGFVAAVVATLALGIGANAAVFSLVDAIILRPVAVGNRDGLIAISQPKPGAIIPGSRFADYLKFSSRATSLADVASYAGTSVALGDGDSTQQVSVHFVTRSYFSLLGVNAGVGRVISPTDVTDDVANPVVVLSAAFWRSRFGGDRAVIGKQVHVGGQLLTVIGVAPEGFHGTDLTNIPDIWAPLSLTPTMHLGLLSLPGTLSAASTVPLFRILGRLAPGTTAARAAAELNLIGGGAGVTPFVVRSLRASAAGRDPAEVLRFVRLMGAVVVLTLLLACLNVANLLTVRANERAKELGIRTALGANAGRLTQQLLTESVMLALTGGVIGLGVAVVMLRLLAVYTLPGAISIDRLSLGLEPRVLAFTFVIAVLTAIGFGVFPARLAARVNVVDALKEQTAAGSTLGRRGVLLAVQIAISLMLVVGAGLFLRSVRAGFNTDVGFDARGIAVVSIPYQLQGKWRDYAAQYFAIAQQAKQSPGITSVAAGSFAPLGGPLAGTRTQSFGPGPASSVVRDEDDKSTELHVVSVTDDYFKVLGTPLLTGRSFGPQDVDGGPRVIVLNESARALFPTESAIGKQVHFRTYVTYTVVGVVKGIKYGSLDEREVPPFAFAPMTQEEPIGVAIMARSDHPHDAIAILKNAIATVAPNVKPQRPRVLSDQINILLMPQRFGATLLSIFAILALCVSAVGIYGTVAFAVARRTTEIGIRMALGAQRGDVLRLVLSESGVAIAGGVALGLVGAGLTTRLLTHYLYEVHSSDWIAFSGAIVVMIVMAILASLVPAGRAVRIDPLKAMRTTD